MYILHPRPTNKIISNTTLPDHIRDLLSKLTIEEKVSLLTARDFSTTRDIPRVQIPSLKTADSTSAVKGASLGNPLSTACFPNTLALAATWDRHLLFEMGNAVAEQARYKAAQIVLGPTVNIHRHPRGGRNFEAFSEDPVLTGQLAASLVNGIQSTGMAACVKHFVCNDGDTHRKKYSSEVDERTLREIYLAPFQWVVREAQPVLLMSAYNKVNGTYCCETPLYQQVAQKEWGFKGSWMSDWYGTESTVAAVEAGLDIEMPGPSKARGSKLLAAVQRGEIGVDTIDERVLGILKMVQRTAEVHSTADEQVGLDSATNNLIRKIASESIVLLKNEQHLLPIDMRKASKIAVIGEPATAYCGGGGSASGLPQYYKQPLTSILAAHPDAKQVFHSPGIKLHRCIPMANPAILSGPQGSPAVEVTFHPHEDGVVLSDVVHRERRPVPIVFLLGHVPAGLDEVAGFTYEMTTTLTPKTSGVHTLAVLATGAFRLLVDDNEILSEKEPHMSVEDFLFVPQELEKCCTFQMQANKPYSIRLITESRRELNVDEPTPHSSKLCFIEEFSDEDDIKAAGDLAAGSDISIVFAGRNNEWESEGSDLDSLLLPKRQNELIKHIAAKCARTIVVLIGGNPFDVRDWIDEVQAVVFAHYPGQEGGSAITDILTGAVCPSGKLPMSWPLAVEDVPSNANFPCKLGPNGYEIKYEEGLRIGYRHFWSHKSSNATFAEERRSALWDFGYGLSYTTFTMESLRVIESKSSDGEWVITAEVTVENTGSVAGAEVVQVYVQDVNASVWRPYKELQGFEKVFLQPGERLTVKVDMLKRYALSFWDEEHKHWLAEKGEFKFHVENLTASYMLEETFSWNGL